VRNPFFASFVIMLLACHNSHSQEPEVYFSSQIDSLDRVHALNVKVSKPLGGVHVIRVRNQKDFDEMNESIIAAVEAGEKNIRVKIKQGVYQFRENHLELVKFHYPDVSISLEGKNAVVTSDADFSSSSYNDSPWQVVSFADGLIEVVDKEQKLCFLPFLNTIDETEEYPKIQVTQWFRAPIYDVTKIDKNGVYFIAPELNYLEQFGRKEYSVNYDFIYSGQKPRFRLYNYSLERPSKSTCFALLKNSVFRSFSIKGLRFYGNKQGESLLFLIDVHAGSFLIEECVFDAIRGSVLRASKADNVIFNRNTVIRTDGGELSFSNGCKNVHVTQCVFRQCGQKMSNTMCVRCNESEYYIANNTFLDFGYCAIGVGLWHGHNKKYDTRGIIEHNEISFSPGYFSQKEKYTLMDSGAIYVWTQNDDAIIRYNYIHDYGGMRFNSGIYCDDGASNCKIYGNVILNTPDGCSISSRRVEDSKEGFRNNVNNFIADNVVDGAVVFGCSAKDQRHCQKGANYVIQTGAQTTYKDRFENLEQREEDVVIKSNDKILRKKIKQCTRR